ncbi:hypothetical protein HYU19_02070 [Candidatus Woesearchaeota archaeon]|nr:hypothetical protein [Candidatus Woesearchaeota archaeon]
MGNPVKKTYILLTLIFVLVLGVRLYFAFQTSTFTGDEAYFTLRQVEHITSHGFPLYNDPLSYGGRSYLFMPLFQMILAFFNLFLPLGLAAKLIPNLLASSVVVIAYFLAKEITGDDRAALFSAFISGFIPVYVGSTVNSVSASSLVFPLLFYAVYCFLKVDEQRKRKKMGYALQFIIALTALIVTNSVVVVLLLSLPLYLLFLKLENLPQSRKEVELTVFSIFAALWVTFLVMKKYFLIHGPMVIWQNLPPQILDLYFSRISILDALRLIGFIPLTYGVYSVFEHIHHVKNRKVYLLISVAFCSAILLWLKLIELNTGLISLGICMAVLFSLLYARTFGYIKNTRISRYSWAFVLLFLAALFASSVLPSILTAQDSVDNALRPSEIRALQWLEKYSEDGDVVTGLPEEGHAITALAKRKNVIDSNYLSIPLIGQRYDDVMNLLTARFETDALAVTDRYHVDYIYFSQRAKKKLGLHEPSYASDKKCFKKIYDKYVKIYEVKCTLLGK